MTNENENSLTINLLKELDNVSRFFKTNREYETAQTIKRLQTAEFLEEQNKLNTHAIPLNIDRVLEIKNKRQADLDYQNFIIKSKKEKFNKRTKSLNIIHQQSEKMINDIYYLLEETKKEVGDSFHSSKNSIIKTNQSSNFMNTLNNEDAIPINTKKRKFIEKFDNLLKVNYIVHSIK